MVDFSGTLKPYAIHIAGMQSAIVGETDEGLVALLVACQKAGKTNCWWAEYEAGQFLRSAVRSEINRRAKAAKVTAAALKKVEP